MTPRTAQEMQPSFPTAPLTEAAVPAWLEGETKAGARMERDAAVRETWVRFGL